VFRSPVRYFLMHMASKLKMRRVPETGMVFVFTEPSSTERVSKCKIRVRIFLASFRSYARLLLGDKVLSLSRRVKGFP
jgi:hypothetical protein